VWGLCQKPLGALFSTGHKPIHLDKDASQPPKKHCCPQAKQGNHQVKDQYNHKQGDWIPSQERTGLPLSYLALS
jgi:hypothetical protein